MIVIDEAAGLSLTLAFAEMSLMSVFLGFVLFRFRYRQTLACFMA